MCRKCSAQSVNVFTAMQIGCAHYIQPLSLSPSLSLEAENVYADCSHTAYGACGDRWRIESSRSMVGGFLYAYCSLCSFRRKLRGLVDDCAYEHPKGYLYHYYESSQCAYVSHK